MDIYQNIKIVIQGLESERNIGILYACESGSRAWGFASPDSDYDLRFIYAHPKAWYLELQEKRDVIDLMLPNDLDLSGWDLAKTLRLFASCNLALNEWLDSPTIYWQQEHFREELAFLIPRFFKPRKAIHHYLSMAKGTAKDNLNGSQIKIKKLFYIMRPLLACHWIEANSSMPPTLFKTMLEQKLISNEILSAIYSIQKDKETAVEGQIIETPTAILNWIEKSIVHFDETKNSFPVGDKAGWSELNGMMTKWCT